jgi:DNA methylase
VLARVPLAGTTTENLGRFGTGAFDIDGARIRSKANPDGYWPANVVLSHAPRCPIAPCAEDCPVGMLDDSDSPRSRFFYCAKASRAEREAGCEQLPRRSVQLYPKGGPPIRPRANIHPCVKPISLLRYLTRLAAPPGGVVLDPFAGSGSVGIAALLEGRKFLGIEQDREYTQIARARLTHWATIAEQEDVLP